MFTSLVLNQKQLKALKKLLAKMEERALPKYDTPIINVYEFSETERALFTDILRETRKKRKS